MALCPTGLVMWDIWLCTSQLSGIVSPVKLSCISRPHLLLLCSAVNVARKMSDLHVFFLPGLIVAWLIGSSETVVSHFTALIFVQCFTVLVRSGFYQPLSYGWVCCHTVCNFSPPLVLISLAVVFSCQVSPLAGNKVWLQKELFTTLSKYSSTYIQVVLIHTGV